MLRRLALTTVLLSYAAAALLGHAGLHAVLGDAHGHSHASVAVDFNSNGHAGHSCSHSHGDSNEHQHVTAPDHEVPVDGIPAPDRHDSDDCVVCQYTEQAQSPLAFFAVSTTLEGVESVEPAARPLITRLRVSAYDSRGPPRV